MTKLKLYILMAVIFIAGCGAVSYTWNKYQEALVENARISNNLEYYSSLGTENIVLKNTINELKQSKDSVVQQLMGTQRKLELKPKETKEIVYVETILTDTIVKTITLDRNFCETLEPNDQTKITVCRKDTTLTVIPDIRNQQTLFVQEEKRYKYKGFFNRLIHFNFSKITTEKYYIDNSNDLIVTGDTRVIKTK